METGAVQRYAVVTPVRNEVMNLKRLARCLAAQAVMPAQWVVVDTGSTDGTLSTARALAATQPWVSVVEAPESGGAARGGPIVRAFERGAATLDSSIEVVVKLDADVSVERDYFERVLAAFGEDSTLGIASGTAYELEQGQWQPRFNTGTSVWGAARAYRRRCLAEVGPLEERMGWDGIDELKAQLRGWTTRTIPELPFKHHRAEGARDGSRWRAWSARGRAAHYMGYRAWYLVARALHHARSEWGALGMIWGYLAEAVARRPVCADAEVRTRLRSEQRFRNLRSRRREALGADR
jgi:glycosyltransferase involved in cell wall biosynthesis